MKDTLIHYYNTSKSNVKSLSCFRLSNFKIHSKIIFSSKIKKRSITLKQYSIGTEYEKIVKKNCEKTAANSTTNLITLIHYIFFLKMHI